MDVKIPIAFFMKNIFLKFANSIAESVNMLYNVNVIQLI